MWPTQLGKRWIVHADASAPPPIHSFSHGGRLVTINQPLSSRLINPDILNRIFYSVMSPGNNHRTVRTIGADISN